MSTADALPELGDPGVDNHPTYTRLVVRARES